MKVCHSVETRTGPLVEGIPSMFGKWGQMVDLNRRLPAYKAGALTGPELIYYWLRGWDSNPRKELMRLPSEPLDYCAMSLSNLGSLSTALLQRDLAILS